MTFHIYWPDGPTIVVVKRVVLILPCFVEGWWAFVPRWPKTSQHIVTWAAKRQKRKEISSTQARRKRARLNSPTHLILTMIADHFFIILQEVQKAHAPIQLQHAHEAKGPPREANITCRRRTCPSWPSTHDCCLTNCQRSWTETGPHPQSLTPSRQKVQTHCWPENWNAEVWQSVIVCVTLQTSLCHHHKVTNLTHVLVQWRIQKRHNFQTCWVLICLKLNSGQVDVVVDRSCPDRPSIDWRHRCLHPFPTRQLFSCRLDSPAGSASSETSIDHISGLVTAEPHDEIHTRQVGQRCRMTNVRTRETQWKRNQEKIYACEIVICCSNYSLSDILPRADRGELARVCGGGEELHRRRGEGWPKVLLRLCRKLSLSFCFLL